MARHTSEKQEQAWRSRELLGLRHILSAILLQQGGGFVLDDRSRMLATPGDEFVDLFPGSGMVSRAWERFRRAPVLPLVFEDQAEQMAATS